MTAEQFAYWLQGFSELTAEPPTTDQWQSIRNHLNLVFEKKTPGLFDGIIKRGPNQVMGPVSTFPGPNGGIIPLRSDCVTTC